MVDNALGLSQRFTDNTIHQAELIPAWRALKILQAFADRFVDGIAYDLAKDLREFQLRGHDQHVAMVLPRKSLAGLRDAFVQWATAQGYGSGKEAPVWGNRLLEFLTEFHGNAFFQFHDQVYVSVYNQRFEVDGHEIAINNRGYLAALWFAFGITDSLPQFIERPKITRCRTRKPKIKESGSRR